MLALACPETARLRLRPRRREDIDAILQMDLDPAVYRYSDMRPNVSMTTPHRGALRKTIRSQILSGSPRNFWVIEWKDRQGLLGLAGLNPNPSGINGLPFHAGTNFLVFRLVKTAWGQGIATEAARAILDYGFRVLMCPTIAAFSHGENRRSRQVLDKIGMDLIGRVVVPQQPVPLGSESRASTSGFLNEMYTPGNTYLCYRLDRETYFDRVGEPARRLCHVVERRTR
jgi:RimJ/RimL family protein N-acetyltransferase